MIISYERYHYVKELYDLIVKVGWLIDWFMVFNATFNNISVISWWLVLLMEETEVPGENHRPALFH